MVDWWQRKAILATSEKLAQERNCFRPKSPNFQDDFLQIEEAFRKCRIKTQGRE